MAIKSEAARARKREYNRQYAKANAEKINAQQKARYRKRRQSPTWCHSSLGKYGLTQEAYDALWASQDGKCAICGGGATDRRLCVDHDHVTGVVRGLLCGKCNTGLGQFKEDPTRIMAAIEYLAKHKREKEEEGITSHDVGARRSGRCLQKSCIILGYTPGSDV